MYLIVSQIGEALGYTCIIGETGLSCAVIPRQLQREESCPAAVAAAPNKNAHSGTDTYWAVRRASDGPENGVRVCV